MAEIEKLTDDERSGLETVEPLSTDWRVQKSLRILDQLSAEVERLRAELSDQSAERNEAESRECTLKGKLAVVDLFEALKKSLAAKSA